MPNRRLTPAQREQADNDRRAALEVLHEQLRTAIERIESGSDWQSWLAFASRLHSYSFRNVMLIRAQRPDATVVASYRTWRSSGRQVRRGETAIRVLAPIVRTRPGVEPTDDVSAPDETSPIEPLSRVVAFRAVPVFDVGQTDGEPVTPPLPTLLAGEAPPGLWEALVDEATARGYRVTRSDAASIGGANGRTDYVAREICVRHDVDPAQAVKTMAHELGHVILHEPDAAGSAMIDCRGVREVEAESVAYLLAAHHGLDASDYSFPYVAHWAYGPAAAEHVPMADLVTRTGDRVMSAAGQLIAVTADVRDDTDAHREAITARVARGAAECERIRADATALEASSEMLSEEDRAIISGILGDSQEFFRRHVGDSWVPAYLAQRGFYEVLADRGIGLAPVGWTTLVDHLHSLGYRDTHIEAAGMASRARTGNLIDRFRDRMTIPIHDRDGHLVAFAGRINPEVAEDKYAPRYVNSPSTAMFSKSNVLFGLGDHRAELESGAVPVVCEGPLDAMAIDIAAARSGLPFVGLAASGTAFTRQHAEQLHAVIGDRRIHLAFDGDEAGRRAGGQAWRRLAEAGTPYVYSAELEAATDPADLIASDRAESLVSMLTASRMASIVATDHWLADIPDTETNAFRQVGALRLLLDESLGLVAPDERNEYVDHLIDRLRLDPSTVAAEVTARVQAQTLLIVEERCEALSTVLKSSSSSIGTAATPAEAAADINARLQQTG